MKFWRFMVYGPLLTTFIYFVGLRVTWYETSDRWLGSPGWYVGYDYGPVVLVAYSTVRTGGRVEIWPYWRPAIVLARW